MENQEINNEQTEVINDVQETEIVKPVKPKIDPERLALARLKFDQALNQLIVGDSTDKDCGPERFYSALVMEMKRIYTLDVPTMGVNVTRNVNLFINPEFILSEAIDKKGLRLIIKHECLHIIHDHITRAKHKEIKPEDHRLFNVACDLAINEFIRGISNYGACDVGNFNKEMPDLKLEHKQTAEYYYDKLKQKSDEMTQKIKEMIENGQLDDHGKWQEGDGGSSVIAKEIIKNAVNNAVKKSGGIGSISGDVALLIEELNKASVNWKQQLRQFFVKSSLSNKTNTRKKRNRRTGLLNPGSKRKPELKIAVAVDTSGSMSDEALKQVFSEISEIHNSGAKVTVIEADSDVKNVYSFDPKKDIQVKGRGGTAYQPAFDYVNKNMSDIDAMIYVGDMDASDSPEKPKYPVLWCVYGNQNPPADFGKTIRIEETAKKA